MAISYFRSAAEWLTRPDRISRTLLIVLAAHLSVWTIYSVLTRENLDGYGDMAENFAWGQEWQLGYHKHPPLFAWVTAIWFRVFPTSDWAYFLLSQANVVVGLAAVWFLAREFLSRRGALIAVLILGFLPNYTFLAIKFNANSILLSLWPLVALFFVRALRHGGALPGILFGLFAGLSVLSKYYSFALLASLFVISVVHGRRKTYYSSSSPYLAMATFALVVSPHVFWLVSNDFLPIRYAADHSAGDYFDAVRSVVSFTLSQLAYLLPGVLAAIFILGKRTPGLFRSAGEPLIIALLLLPFALTLLAGLLLGVEISSVWGLPLWFLFGAFVAERIDPDLEERACRRGLIAIFGFHVLVLLVAAPVAITVERRAEKPFSPRQVLAEEVTFQWRERFSEPLSIVAGTRPYPESIAFYSSDHPSVFIDLNERYSPWIDESRLKREGIAVVCQETDPECLRAAKDRFGDSCQMTSLSFQRPASQVGGGAVRFELCLVPPDPRR